MRSQARSREYRHTPRRSRERQASSSGLWSLTTWRTILDTLLDVADVSKVEHSSSRGRKDSTSAMRRPGRRWVLAFWAGVMLAPIAAMLLLLAEGVGSLRIAAVLAVLSSVLIGLSVIFRDDSLHLRAELAGEFREEMTSVKSDVETLRRGMQLTINRELERVRGELDEARSVIKAHATRVIEPSHRTQALLLPSRDNGFPPAVHQMQTVPRRHVSDPISGDVLAPLSSGRHGATEAVAMSPQTYANDPAYVAPPPRRGRHSAD